jgi:5-methylcytosine-specific restriction protein A
MPRPGASKRGYTPAWMAAAARFREEHPLCNGCFAIGVVRAATVVDHIVPHDGNQELFWNEANWQPACEWHHNSIKPMLERQWRAHKISSAALRLGSTQAVALTRARHRPAVGVDGFKIPGT